MLSALRFKFFVQLLVKYFFPIEVSLISVITQVRYVMRRVFGDPKNAPPPLEKLTPEETVSFLWNGDGSLVEEILQCLSPHVEEGIVDELRSKIRAHDPSGSADVLKDLQRSLLWLVHQYA